MSGAKYRDMSELLGLLGAYSRGVTVKQIMEEIERSRATVDRMLNTLRLMKLVEQAPPLDEDHHRVVRWKTTAHYTVPGALPADLNISERSDLERLLNSLDEREAKSGLIKLLSREKPLNLNSVYDLNELIERDANVGRVGPQNIVSKETRSIIDQAISDFQKVSFIYRDEKLPRKISPAGALFARFNYLVGFDNAEIPKTFRMDLITEPTLLDEMLEIPEGWNFKIWSRRSFGVFHGDESTAITLQFDQDISERVKKVQFHPSQQIIEQEDGSVIVKLFCCGHRELLHELMHPDWAGRVQILEPSSLLKELDQYLRGIREKNGLIRT